MDDGSAATVDGPEPAAAAGAAARQAPVSDDSYLDLARALAHFIRRARRYARHAAQAIDPELEPGTYPLLSYLHRNPGARLSEIADVQCVGKGTMSRQLARLEGLGLIARDPDPEDSRGVLFHLPPESAERVTRVKVAQAQLLREATADWPEEDVRTFSRLLERLSDAVD